MALELQVINADDYKQEKGTPLFTASSKGAFRMNSRLCDDLFGDEFESGKIGVAMAMTDKFLYVRFTEKEAQQVFVANCSIKTDGKTRQLQFNATKMLDKLRSQFQFNMKEHVKFKLESKEKEDATDGNKWYMFRPVKGQ